MPWSITDMCNNSLKLNENKKRKHTSSQIQFTLHPCLLINKRAFDVLSNFRISDSKEHYYCKALWGGTPGEDCCMNIWWIMAENKQASGLLFGSYLCTVCTLFSLRFTFSQVLLDRRNNRLINRKIERLTKWQIDRMMDRSIEQAINRWMDG